jgi:hypothetical protein
MLCRRWWVAAVALMSGVMSLAACTAEGAPDPVVVSPTSVSGTSGATSGGLVPSEEFDEHPPLSGAAASSVAAGMVSGDLVQMSAVVVYPTGVNIGPSVLAGMQALAPINLEEKSFVQLSDDEAYVYAAVGRDQQPWTLFLVWRDGRWMVADTLEGRQ